MPLTFNLLLQSCGIDPRRVRLLRHDTRELTRTAWALWRDDRSTFEGWQAIQRCDRRGYFAATCWASFVVTPDGKTVFVGLYEVGAPERPTPGHRDPLRNELVNPEWVDIYPFRRSEAAAEYAGRLAVEWGHGTRAWVQSAAKQDKPITELRSSAIDPPFPGFARFTAQLSEIRSLPPAWRTALAAVSGVYLLTCPRTHEQYVGSASGADGLLGRWMSYVEDGHGGNIALRSRDLADYRISILQVAGSAEDREGVVAMEALWKVKLQSREMGLNRN